ncbi:LysR family transcriptional regulator [Methylobacterium planeticum]|uniref:LysR family transcriptional regulator n=1 Tax=Methylobacterium planeticum TaxID=2615211 RepID=A0A6N6MIA2_9HYPH|nr:LysR family transcriptional regulator [Methylobacterium planeticum]KAB1069208.1 LysR family transcriptional regulator [Methylobacterium planeticum]
MRLSPADLRGLMVFRAIVEHGGFTGAQLALGMSQSTVSFHLKSLEERLDFELCQRGRRGFQVTARGREVYEASKALVGAISGFEGRLGDLKQEVFGTLRVGLVDNTITDPNFRMEDVIEACMRKGDQLEIQILIAHPENLIAELSKGGIDIAITPQIEFISGFAETIFRTEVHSLYCSDRHPLFATAETASVEQIISHDFVLRPYTNKKELRHFSRARVRAHASSMEAQTIFILSGRLIGYLPDHYARSWVNVGRLRPLLTPQTQITSQFVILSNNSDDVPRLQHLFMKELLTRFGETSSRDNDHHHEVTRSTSK